MKTYIIAAKLNIEPTVYIEVIAKNEADALKQCEERTTTILDNNRKQFKYEASVDIKDAYSGQITLIKCGRASQYHHESTCKLCTRALKGRAK